MENKEIDLGMGIKLFIAETKTMGKIVIMDNYIKNGFWNRERRLLK